MQLGRVGALLERFAGPNLTLAMACFVNRRRHRVVFTDGEQVGLPFAALCWLTRRRPCHIMIGHRLSARKKVLVHRLLRLQRHVDRVVVYASAQRRFAIEHLGYEPQQRRASSLHGRHRLLAPRAGRRQRPARGR